MPELLVPASDELSVSLGVSGQLVRKKATEVSQGDRVLCFVAESYAPTITGHFRFLRVDEQPSVRDLPSGKYNWFSGSDGPQVSIPNAWSVLIDGQFHELARLGRPSVVAFPGHLHDTLPPVLGLELFTGCFANASLLTEASAYFLGAFALRPQCYPFDGDTWGIFGVRFNVAGAYGVGRAQIHDKLRAWYKAHRDAVVSLAQLAWGAGNFIVEERASAIGLSDVPVPSGHRPDAFVSRTSPVGFMIHAPVARGVGFDCDASPENADLRLVQYWYSCIESHMLERTTVATRKAFLLGAFDTMSNADSDRGSIGLDFPDRFVGEFPLYSIVHSVGRSVLDTFDEAETSNPRETSDRTRGRIPRCQIWDEIENVGFLSPLRADRAVTYAGLIDRQMASLPAPNVLSALFHLDVQTLSRTLADGTTYGSDESDLSVHTLVRARRSGETVERYVALPVSHTTAFAASSLPLGSVEVRLPRTNAVATRSGLRLVRQVWIADALEKIAKITTYISNDGGPKVSDDMMFEYLIAVLASQLSGCVEAWVIPRHEDEGIDIAARFEMGSAQQGSHLGDVTAAFQAKLQSKKVGRRVIDQARGSLFRMDAALGFVVTNNGFTQPATRSSTGDHPRIRLIDGESLIHMLLQHRVGLYRQGAGNRQTYFLDLTFFETLRNVVRATRALQGRILVNMQDGLPVPHLTP